MMENDDKMIRDFFASHKQKVVDDGFSAKVIKSLQIGRASCRERVYVLV